MVKIYIFVWYIVSESLESSPKMYHNQQNFRCFPESIRYAITARKSALAVSLIQNAARWNRVDLTKENVEILVEEEMVIFS